MSTGSFSAVVLGQFFDNASPELDVMVCGGNVCLLRSGGGQLGTTETVSLAPGVSVVAIAAGDLDGDGDDDVALVVDDELALFEISDGVALPHALVALDATPRRVGIADLDDDDRPDILVALGNAGVRVFFQSPQ